jgi:hypothetical protein
LPTSLPLSRHRTIRISRYVKRLDAMVAALDAGDRRLPLTPAFAGLFRRTIQEGRALVGLPPATHLERTLKGVDFFLEAIVIWHVLGELKPLPPQPKTTFRGKRYPPLPAPW